MSLDLLDEKGVDPYTRRADRGAVPRAVRLSIRTPSPAWTTSHITRQLIAGGGRRGGDSSLPTTAAPFWTIPSNVLCCDIHTRARTKRPAARPPAPRWCYGLDEHPDRAGQRQRLQREIRPAGLQQGHRGDASSSSPATARPLCSDVQRSLRERTGKHR